jgi:hypothetical protein
MAQSFHIVPKIAASMDIAFSFSYSEKPDSDQTDRLKHAGYGVCLLFITSLNRNGPEEASHRSGASLFFRLKISIMPASVRAEFSPFPLAASLSSMEQANSIMNGCRSGIRRTGIVMLSKIQTSAIMAERRDTVRLFVPL